MTEKARIACSLDAADMQERLVEIAAVGAASLSRRERTGDRHRLRFRPDPGTRKRLEAIVAAEAACCPFLEIEMEVRGDELLLTLAAPEEGEAVADALAAAFGDDTPPQTTLFPSAVSCSCRPNSSLS